MLHFCSITQSWIICKCEILNFIYLSMWGRWVKVLLNSTQYTDDDERYIGIFEFWIYVYFSYQLWIKSWLFLWGKNVDLTKNKNEVKRCHFNFQIKVFKIFFKESEDSLTLQSLKNIVLCNRVGVSYLTHWWKLSICQLRFTF